MIRTNQVTGFSLVLLLVIAACIDPIDFEVPAGVETSIVVQGRVVKADPSFVEVNVSRLFDFTPESRQPVSLREVVLSDDSNNEMVLETRTPGNYKVILDETTPIQAEVGVGYSIYIETFDNRVYESTFDIMPANEAPEELNVSVTQFLRQDVLGEFVPADQVSLDITTPVDISADGGIYWEIDNTFQVTDTPGFPDPEYPIRPKTCWLTKTTNVNEIYVLDPSELSQGRIENFVLTNTPITWLFAEGLYYEVRQYSLSAQAYAYWRGIDILSEREGTMFDPPVGEVPSNIKNVEDDKDPIFGFFFASEEQFLRIKVDESVTGLLTSLCPRPPESMCSHIPGEGCTCGLCCDCLIDPDATVTKPDYWID